MTVVGGEGERLQFIITTITTANEKFYENKGNNLEEL